MSGSLYGLDQLTLVLGAGAGYAAGDNFAFLGDKPVQQPVVLIIDVEDTIFAETTDLFVSDHHLPVFSFQVSVISCQCF